MQIYIPQYVHEDYYQFYENLTPCWTLEAAKEVCDQDLKTRYPHLNEGKSIEWNDANPGYVDHEYNYCIEIWNIPDVP